MLNHGYLEIMSCPSVMDALVATPGYIKLFFKKKPCPSVVFYILEQASRFREA